MVFESVLTDVLNKFVGEYVVNLDKKQLKLGIWGGDVVLKGLQLRENAFDEFDLPLQLIYGYLGSLVLKIPWKNLYSQPVIAQVEDLHLLIAPKQSIKYNPEKEEKYDLQAKQTALQALEDQHKRELEKDLPKPDATFAEKLTAQIVNNLQVKISNVHIRYEDSETTGKPIAFGLSLYNLELYTTDANWEKKYISEKVSKIFKVANMDSLSVYLNCTSVPFSKNLHRIDELFRKNIARTDMIPDKYSFVFGPLSSHAKLQLNMNPELDKPAFQIPKVDLNLDMEKLNIGLTSTQFQYLLKLGDTINRMQLGIPYRKYRPFNIAYKGHYKEWWKFAITAVLEEDVKKKNRCWSWEHIKEHRELCRTYAEKHKERATSKKLPANLVETCTLLEQKLDLFNLVLIRQRVQIELDKIKKEQEEKAAAQSGWFSSWFGYGKKTAEEPTDFVKRFEAAMTDEEKHKLYKAIGYHENMVAMEMPLSYQAIIVNFKLVKLNIGLYDDQSVYARDSYDFNLMQTILLLEFSMTTCKLLQRPAASAISLFAGMNEMTLTGLEKQGVAPTIVESKITDELNLIDVFFETNPLDKKCDKRIKVHTRPLQIIYNADTINHLMKTFSPPQTVNLSELEGAATARMSMFKERSATGMQYMIESHDVMDVDITFMPNILIVPRDGVYIPKKKSLIVVSLGQLTIISKPRSKNTNIYSLFSLGMGQEQILESVMQDAYDKFRISLDNMQVLIVRPEELWEEVLTLAMISDMHALRPTSIEMSANLCVVDDDPRLPKTKVDIIIPSIYFDVTEDRFFEALQLVSSIPTPENNLPPEEPTTLVKTLSTASSRLSVATSFARKSRGSASTTDTITSEIIQYTTLQCTFALKELCVTLYKSAAINVSEKTTPTDSNRFGTPIEEIFHASEDFVDSNSELTLLSPLATEAQKTLSFKILQLEAKMSQRTYEMEVEIKLGAINLTQHLESDENKTEISIIDTPRFSEELEYLLTISYITADRKSPEWMTKYNLTEQLININFSTLNVILHQEYILHLLELAAQFQTKMEAVNQSATPAPPQDRIATAAETNVVSHLATILEDENEESTQQTKVTRQSRSNRVVESIKIHLIANMDLVSVMLTCHKRPIMLFKVQTFVSDIILKSSYTEVNLLLKDILVKDLNPVTLHPNILSIVGNDAFKCQVVMYNITETSNYNSDDMKVICTIGCMKIVFINWFITSVLSFLNNFQAAQQAVANASAAAADVAQQKAIDAYEKATRMKLDIKIKAPVIIVPIDSQSRNGILLDLGYLSLSNITSEVSVSGEERSPAILDSITLELSNMKLSKVTILETTNNDSIEITNSIDTVDIKYGAQQSDNIMDPISFVLSVERNLSSNWYKEVPEMIVSGRLKSIEFNLYMEDYALIMSILNKNMVEGVDEFEVLTVDQPKPVTPPSPPPHPLIDPEKKEKSAQHWNSTLRKMKLIETKKKIDELLRFSLVFDGIVVNLMLERGTGLARFGLYFLSIKGKKLANETTSLSIVLCNIQIDDLRRNIKSEIKQYLCRKDWKAKKDLLPLLATKNDILEICRAERNYMLDVTAIVKENDSFAEVRICGFDMILCIEFLMRLSEFMTLPDDVSTPPTPPAYPTPDQKLGTKAPVKCPPPVNPKSKTSLIVHLEEPDIILVESLEDINTNAIIFNMQAKLNYRVVGEKQLMNGQIDSLKMYMCSFKPEKRESTKHYILHPCVISLQGSTPENKGLHLSLKFSDIILNVSPATIELFNKASMSLSAGSTEKAAEQKTALDYSDIWKPKTFNDRDHWFVKADNALEAIDLEKQPPCDTLLQSKTEKCIIEIPCIIMVVEMGVGYYTTPLISIDTSLNAVVSDWSQNMSVNGSLSVNMNYYNQSLAVWEPILEKIEHFNRELEKEYTPWELNFSLNIESNKADYDNADDDGDDNEEADTTTNIKIHSRQPLELTMSKTCLDLLSVLGEAFGQAIEKKGLTKPDIIAPYLIENDTGFEITLNFKSGIFTLHECHGPSASNPTTLNQLLLFKVDETDFKPDLIEDCKISPGGRVYLQTKDLSKIQNEEDGEYNLHLKIDDLPKEVILSVSKSDKRYFSLFKDKQNDPWGVITEVRSEYGTTIVNIHSVLNIHNHFATKIEIYRTKQNTLTQKQLVGEVASGKVYHVPLHAVYANDKDLYFAINGYKTSVQGIRWTDTPTDLNYSRHLQCDPKETFEPLYINAIREKTEVFYENTNKYKLLSAFYTIHLRPPLYLRNALPINIKVSVAGCSVKQNTTVKAADLISQAFVEATKKGAKEDFLDYGEKEIRPGDCLHLPTVKMTGKSKDNRSFLVVRLMQYLEKDWSCTTEISEDHETLATWTFASYDSVAKMEMELCVRFDNRQGSLQVTLYSPFWMINKTELMLSYKTDTETVDVLYHPPEYKGPILYSFREKFFFDKKRAAVRVDNGDWSDKIPLDVAGSLGAVTCKSKNQTYQIGVHNHLTHNNLTKQITFIPFYIATNKCEFPIQLQEQSRPGDPWTTVAVNGCVPIWPKNDSDHMLVCKVHDQLTAPFNYTDMQCILLRLNDNKYGGINVDVQVTEGGVYIVFTEYNLGDAPGLIFNHTPYSITFKEKGTMNEHLVKSRNKILFTWTRPVSERFIVFGKNHIENDLRRDGVGEVVFPNNVKVFWVSFLDGLQRVFLFTNIEAIAKKSESSSALQTITRTIELSLHSIGMSLVNNESGIDIIYMGFTSSGIIWESKKLNRKRFKQLNLHDTANVEEQYQQYLIDKGLEEGAKAYIIDDKYRLNFDDMKMMKNGIREIRRTFLPGVWVSMKTSPFQTQLHVKINKIQIDNQLHDCIFPVVLAPIPPPKSVATTISFKPFVEISVVERLVPNSTIKQYKYASMLIQEFHFKVDILFLTALADMFTSKLTDDQEAKLFNLDVHSIETPLTDLVETHSQQEQKNFYDMLHLGPLKMHLSFSMAGSDTKALPSLLSVIIQGIGVTLTDANDVVFRLSYFEREYKFFTQNQLNSEIAAHYTGQFVKQLYVLVLGLDVLGNPFGLVIGLKKGVEDLFYEPFQGAIQGPGEFAEGLVLGVKSLFGHAVGGAAGAVSKITGAMGKGLAVLTFDEEYQRKRRLAMNRKPTNFQEGMARSGKGLLMGFVDGVTGVVTKPVAGAREEGVEGFFKGLGKGAIGLVTRPTAGVVDFASDSLGAVKRATEGTGEVNRLRPPRFFHLDTVLREYCRAEAEGSKMLREIEKGKYATTDTFVHCAEIVKKSEFVVVSNHRVLYVIKNDLFGTWNVQWTYLWTDIIKCQATIRGVELTLKRDANKKVMGLFSSNEVQRKLILIPQKIFRDKLAEIMENQRVE